MGKIIGFRVDVNEDIATGHLMRCITIAKECLKNGNRCVFFVAEGKMTEQLVKNNIPFCVLHSKWNDLDAEIKMLVAKLKDETIDVLVVDSYQASPKYLKTINSVLPVCYLDDMAKEKYDVSMLIHYCTWPDDDSYIMRYDKTETKILSGMQYVPLRSEFERTKVMRGREKSILITTGGTDPYNVSGEVVRELLKRECCKEYIFKVVIGAMNANITLLEELSSDKRVELLRNVNNMGELMRMSQCAVSAGGTTLFELCASEIPTVCFSFAENQEKFCEEMGQREVMLYAGEARKVENIHIIIANKIEQLLKNQMLAKRCAEKMRIMVDGYGASRIAEALIGIGNRN